MRRKDRNKKSATGSSKRFSKFIVPLALIVPSVAFLMPVGTTTVWASTGTQSNPWPANPNWQQYVESPSNRNVHPVKVVSVSGDVTNAKALVNGKGSATLTMKSGGSRPTIILDYGKDVGGIPKFGVTAASGSPTLQAGYSESQKYISPTGDGASPWASGDPKRYDTYTVTGPGTITNRYIQGGERYEEITLTSPGSVSLSSAEIYFEPVLSTPDTYKGYFVSSSNELNKIWYAGAYTAQLDTVRPGTAEPPLWTVSNHTLTADGTSSGPGFLKMGSNWTDYTISFRTAIVNNQAGWIVRANPKSYYLLILNSSDDKSGTPNTLQQVAYSLGGYHVIGNVKLPFTVTPGTYYNVKTTVQGSSVTTYINGQKVASFDTSKLPSGIPALSSGTVGIREYSGEKAEFQHLNVTDASGNVLYKTAFDSSSTLKDFNIPGNNGNNSLSLILDGAKRDRAVWSGDLSFEGPNVFDSIGANQYIRDSLQLLGSYQGTNGYVSGDMPPQMPLHTGPLNNYTAYAYSASYSMYFVRDLAEYYRYTGDKSFVQKEWPTVKRELAWSASQVDSSNGLFITNPSDGRDWDYYDGSKTGGVTVYNALYYNTLLDGAFMAKDLGHADLAAKYLQQAADLKKAINTNLFNPKTGVYDVSTKIRGTIAQDANAFAILFGIAPKDKVSSILATVKKNLWTNHGPLPYSANTGFQKIISPYVSGYSLLARLSSGDTSDAMNLLNDVWGQMVKQGPYYTGALWENMNQDGNPLHYTSLAHGWASGPTPALSQYVLGARPINAGYKTWIIQPHVGNLSWTEGKVPTPYGSLGVKWGHETSNQKFVMEVQSPKGTSGTIAVPQFNREAVIHVNGKLVWNNGKFHAAPGITGAHTDGKYVYLKVSSAGNYHITSKATGI